MNAWKNLVALLQQESFEMSFSEMQGMLIGIICAGSCMNGKNWIEYLQAVSDFNFNQSPWRERLLDAYQQMEQKLRAADFSLELYIGDMHADLQTRALFLSLWCSGFIHGLEFAQLKIADAKSEEARDSLFHISEISQLDFENIEAEEEEETFFMQVYEYVRMAVTSLYLDFNDNSPRRSSLVDIGNKNFTLRVVMITQTEYQQRRQQIGHLLGADSVAIIPTAAEVLRNGSDNPYTFRPDSDFYYVTGFTEPNAVAVLIPGEKTQYILFNQVKDLQQEIWTGIRVGQEGAITNYGADQAYPIACFEEKLRELIAGKRKIYFKIGGFTWLDKLIGRITQEQRALGRTGINPPIEWHNIDDILHEMRLIKSDAEIEVISRSCQIAAQAHQQVMQACQSGSYEYQLAATFSYQCAMQGATQAAYDPIFANGENACILHYTANRDVLQAQQLLLVDAGCEYEYYASDITRTFPISGRFSGEQKAIYEIVLQANQQVINLVKPGTSYEALQITAKKALINGLLDLGILSGSVDECLDTQSYRQFYMHNIGHWMGLDVHDVGRYKLADGSWRQLAPGMVLTVEPGIYIMPADNVDKRWWNIGVRIEDDVLVTEQSQRVLTQAAVKQINEIEDLMQK